MPKLSKKTLDKRFQCYYCEETFRTRQGLSGHIQFKHQAIKYEDQAIEYEYQAANKKEVKVPEIDMRFLLSKSKHLLTWQATNGLPLQTNKTISNLLTNWFQVRNLFKAHDLKLTEQDLKTYVLAGLGSIFSKVD
jgi:hypothetical protein